MGSANRHSFKPGNPGRPKGAKDKVPRFTVRRAFEEVAAKHRGEGLMVAAITAGLKDKRRALGYLELAGKVLDRTEQTAGVTVTVNLNSTCDFSKLKRKA